MVFALDQSNLRGIGLIIWKRFHKQMIPLIKKCFLVGWTGWAHTDMIWYMTYFLILNIRLGRSPIFWLLIIDCLFQVADSESESTRYVTVTRTQTRDLVPRESVTRVNVVTSQPPFDIIDFNPSPRQSTFLSEEVISR